MVLILFPFLFPPSANLLCIHYLGIRVSFPFTSYFLLFFFDMRPWPFAGATFLVWFGPTSRVTISDPVLIREIFISKAEFYEKNESHPLVRKLEGDGLLTLQGEKWAHHRKIISPTFHMENVKVSSTNQFKRKRKKKTKKGISPLNYFNLFYLCFGC